MKNLNRNVVSTMTLTSSKNDTPKTGVMENIQNNLSGYNYINNGDGTISATKGVEEHKMDALSFVAVAAIKTPLKPEWYTTGQLQDKVVLPCLGLKPFEYKTATVQNIVVKGHYLTAAQYLKNCYALKTVPQIDIESVKDKLAEVSKFTTTDGQALYSIINDAITLLNPVLPELTPAEQATYDRLVEIEKPLVQLQTELAELGLTDFTFTGEKSVTGKVDTIRMTAIQEFIQKRIDLSFTNELRADFSIYLTATIK